MSDNTLQRRYAIAVGVAAGISILTLAAGPAFAKGSGGKPAGGGGSSSLLLVNETAPGTAPSYGQTITFNVSTSATSQPNVAVSCSQNGTQVYSASAGFYSGYPWPANQNMVLSSGSWSGGAANCTATLYYYGGGGKAVNLSSLGFSVSA